MALTPESLVTSLHQHLDRHTNLLPALHAQLGLPQSALQQELQHLQETLLKVVDGQLVARQKDVDDWMQKCEGIERDCIEMVKCVGSHLKNVPSVGELRKMQVLPQRHQQLLSLQEKLLAIYDEQARKLAKRQESLVTLTRTLGPSFFPSDLLTLPTAGPDGRINVSPEQFKRLEQEYARGKAEEKRRLAQLSSTLELIVWFYDELGLELPTPDMVPAEESGHERILADFITRWEEAEREGLAEGEFLGVEDVQPTQEVMDWAEDLKTELEDVKSHRESQIQALFDELEPLWKRLGVSDEEIDEFVDQNRGSTETTIQAYHDELDRMAALRRESMSVFINNARQEIVELWEELILAEDERAEFTPFLDDDFDEDLLTRHEEEIARLKEERRIKAPILASINKYFDVCEDERKLAESAADQTRLLGRGPRDPGRLLREEKMRKRVKKEKPRLERELLDVIPRWEEERGKHFLVNGIRVVDVLMESVEAEASKENKKKPAPKANVPARATTPNPPQHAGPSTGTVRKAAATPMTSGPAAKKQKTGPAPTPANNLQRPSSSFGMNSVSSTTTSKTPFGVSQKVNRPPSATGMAPTVKLVTKTKATPMQDLGLGHHGATGTVMRTASGTTHVTATARVAAARKRESFRPRASLADESVFGMGGMKNLGRPMSRALVDVSE